MADRSELSEFPSWITSTFEIQSNGTSDDRAKFARTTLKLLEAVDAGDSSVQWKIEADGTPLTALRRELSSLVVIGSGEGTSGVVQFLGERCVAESLPRPVFIDTSDVERGGLLFDAVRSAFTATTLLCVFSGEAMPDLLTAVALGAHTPTDREVVTFARSQRRTLPRAALALMASEATRHTLPTVVRGMRDALVTSDRLRAREEAWTRFGDTLKRVRGRAD
jgi:hypothetical protein